MTKKTDLEELREDLWSMQTTHMERTPWNMLSMGLLLFVLGLALFFPLSFVRSLLSLIPIGLGVLFVWCFVYLRIVDSAIAERLGWIDHSLEFRLHFLKGKYGLRKGFSKKQLERIDVLMKQKTRPSEEEWEQVFLKEPLENK